MLMFNNHYKLEIETKKHTQLITREMRNNLQEIIKTRVELTTKLKKQNIENVVFASEM